ncbi:MAG TPA: hypothetical protein VHX49_14410, partial [Candidatus Acidoferrales bacterium]|nr:hypothetical protein [Candidatus Acidoferrales bacterium]
AFAFAGLARRLLPSNHILSAGRAVRRATPLLRQTLRLHLQTGSSTTKNSLASTAESESNSSAAHMVAGATATGSSAFRELL